MKVVEKGDEAKRFLDNPVWVEAVEKYRRYIVKEWAEETDEACREYRWHELRALEDVQTHLQSFIEDGTYEAHKNKKGWNKG